MGTEVGKQTYPKRHDWLDAVHRCSHLHPKTKNIAWAIFSHADKVTLWCFPNLDQLSADLGGSRSGKNVRGHITALERAGFLRVGHKMIQGHLSNNYTLINTDLVCSVDHVDLRKDWLYEVKADLDREPPALDSEPPALDSEPPALDSERPDHQEQAVTLSLTLSCNSVTDSDIEKPSASKVSKDKQDPSTSSSWLSVARPNAALPPYAEDEDFFSEVERLLDGPASQDAASPQDVLVAIRKMGDEIFTSDSFFPDSLTRQNAASPPIADIEHQLAWNSRDDEIPNEEW